MNPTKTKRARAARSAFTLIELLTVIAILAILVAMTLGIIGYAQSKAAEEKTRAGHAVVKAGIDRYFDRFGEYPEPVDNSGTGLGGAIALYQALNDDGGDQLVGGSGASTGLAGEDKLVDLKSEGLVGHDGTDFYVKDGYDRAFLYQVHDKANPEATHQQTYDLWSYGDDKEKTNETKWIKNW